MKDVSLKKALETIGAQTNRPRQIFLTYTTCSQRKVFAFPITSCNMTHGIIGKSPLATRTKAAGRQPEQDFQSPNLTPTHEQQPRLSPRKARKWATNEPSRKT